VSRIFAPAARQTANDADRHVLIANDLTAQPNSRQASRRQHVTLGDGHLGRLAFEKLNAARRAARIAATGVQLVDSRILLKGEH
jgi:hypothetical protein